MTQNNLETIMEKEQIERAQKKYLERKFKESYKIADDYTGLHLDVLSKTRAKLKEKIPDHDLDNNPIHQEYFLNVIQTFYKEGIRDLLNQKLDGFADREIERGSKDEFKNTIESGIPSYDSFRQALNEMGSEILNPKGYISFIENHQRKAAMYGNPIQDDVLKENARIAIDEKDKVKHLENILDGEAFKKIDPEIVTYDQLLELIEKRYKKWQNDIKQGYLKKGTPIRDVQINFNDIIDEDYVKMEHKDEKYEKDRKNRYQFRHAS